MATILYRCPAPTDWLCTCGRVARELRRHGVAYEEVRTAGPRSRARGAARVAGADDGLAALAGATAA